MTGFFERYMPEQKGRIGMLQTPVIVITKNNKPIRWHYKLNANDTAKKGEESNYYKGLGTWNTDDLKYVVQKDGLNKMIDILEFDDDTIIEEWLGKDSEPRKKYILANDFSIAKV